MGPRGPGKPEKLVGGIQDQGQMERWGEGGDGCDAGRRVIQVEGGSPLESRGLTSNVRPRISKGISPGEKPGRWMATFWNVQNVKRVLHALC